MFTRLSFRQSIPTACGAVAAMALLSLTTGCSLSPTLAPSGDGAQQAVTLSGKVHGGQQPLYNSTIGLYKVGTTGYGAGSTNLLTSTVKTAVDGSFNITGDYNSSCQSSNELVYLTATGGDPTDNVGGSINNSAIELVAALGPCGSLTSSSFIQINEVTTVAAAFALGQFVGGFGGTDAIGSSSTNTTGMANAFASAANLASVSSGQPGNSFVTGGTSVSMTGFDLQKLATIANIISDCVNQTANTATPCTTLFADVTPYYAPRSTSTLATAATDTFQAAVYMSLNPTSNNSSTTSSNSSTNMSALMALQTPFMAFAPALSAAPTDWTLAVQYSQTNLSYTSSAAVDANGDLWFTNAAATGGLFHMSGGSALNGGAQNITGTQIGFYTGSTGEASNGARQVAIDQQGDAWWSGYTTNYLFKTTSSGGTGATIGFADTFSTLPYAVSIDGNDQVMYSTANSYVLALPGTSVAGATVTGANNIENGSGAASIAITSGGSPTAYAPAKGGSGVYYFATNPIPSSQSSAVSVTDSETANYGTAVDGNNKIWAVNEAASGSLVSGTSAGFTTVASGGCMATPQMVAIDGNNNVWVTSSTTVTASNEGGSSVTFDGVCEYSNSGTLLSSSYGFGPHSIATGRGIAVDLAGNVWVTSYATTSTNVTEIVGAAVPAVAPLSTALKNGTVGTRP